MLGLILMAQGRFDEANDAINAEPGDGYRFCGLTLLYHAMGRKAESDTAMQSLLEEGGDWGFQIAIAYATRQQIDDQAMQISHVVRAEVVS